MSDELAFSLTNYQKTSEKNSKDRYWRGFKVTCKTKSFSVGNSVLSELYWRRHSKETQLVVKDCVDHKIDINMWGDKCNSLNIENGDRVRATAPYPFHSNRIGHSRVRRYENLGSLI